MPSTSAKKLVAIAGGSSAGLGSTLVRHISESSTCAPVILSRAKEPSHPGGSRSNDAHTGVETRYVDYTDLLSLTQALQGVHTVLSVLLANDPDAYLQSQLNLLHATRDAGGTRFAPSEWALGPDGHALLQPCFTPKIAWWEECRRVAADARAKGDAFEVARFATGTFMVYLGYGAPYEPLRATGGRGEQDEPCEFFFGEGRMEYPVRIAGGAPRFSLTDMEDIGCFVRAAVELPDGQWEEEMGMVGDTIRFDEVPGIFEEVTGRKLDVTVLSAEDLDRRLKDAQDRNHFMDTLNTQLMQVHAHDKVNMGIIDPVVNRKCPHVKPMTVRQFIERFWGGRN